MYIKVHTPRLCDLKSLPRDEELMRIATLGPWEIGVPNRSNLGWSIILAYLIPVVRKSAKIFEERFHKVATEETLSLEKIDEGVKCYNPFQNRHAIFYHDDLRKVISNFYTKLYIYIHNGNNRVNFEGIENIFHKSVKKKGRPGQKSVDVATCEAIIQAACLVLQCKIIVISKLKNNHTQNSSPCDPLGSTVYPRGQCSKSDKWKDSITLYETRRTSGKKIRISFGLSETIALRFQENAFRNFLKMGGVTRKEDVDKAFTFAKANSNFIIALLKNRNFKLIENLYQQSPYVLRKLEDAGFITDPQVCDGTNESAFYYAVCSGPIKVLYLLYDYATNACEWSASSSREPDAPFVANLMELKTLLVQTSQKIEAQVKSSDKEKAQIVIKELSEFHNFQLEVSRKMIANRQMINYNPLPDSLYDVEKRKEVIVAILKVYENHFNINCSSMAKRNTEDLLNEQYQSYRKYIRYFQNLDFHAALLFFDNSFALKERLKLDDDQYEMIESAYFRFIFVNKYYTSMDKMFKHQSSRQPISPTGGHANTTINCSLLQLSYLERTSFEKEIDNFKRLLEETPVTNDSITKGLPESEIHTLTTLPEIKDEFILFRLQHYIDLAVKVDLKTESEMGILVIERALQILGETLKLNTKESTTLGKSFLSTGLPMEVAHNASNIRDLLSHSQAKQIYARLEIEKDESLFVEIQKELRNIRNALSHIYKLQHFRIRKYVFQHAIDLIEENSTPKQTENLTTPLSEKENFLTDSFQERYFDEDTLSEEAHRKENEAKYPEFTNKRYLPERRKKIEDRNQNLKMCFKMLSPNLEKLRKNLKLKSDSLGNEYKNHLNNHYNRIEQYIEEEKKRPTKIDDIKQWLKSRFSSLVTLLEFIVDASGYVFDLSEDQRNDLLGALRLKNFDDFAGDVTKIGTLDNAKHQLKEFRAFAQHVQKTLLIRSDDNSVSASKLVFQCPHIEKVKHALKGYVYLSEISKRNLLSEVPSEFKELHFAKEKLLQSLRENGEILPCDVRDEEFKKLKLSSNKFKELQDDYEDETNRKNALYIIDKVKDPFQLFKISLDDNELNKRDFDHYCDIFKFSDSTKEVLGKLVKGQSKPAEDISLQFLLDRVTKLHDCLIKSNADINRVWSNAKSLKTKQYIHDQMVRCYRRQPILQSSVELLLFDCVSVLKTKRADLVHLWTKTSHLFNGINLRNVLAHGNPLFEAVGKILDPCDLPSEIISKVVELISDLEAIDAMQQLYKKTNAKFAEIVEIINKDLDDENKALRDKIKNCTKWQDYAFLIPEQ